MSSFHYKRYLVVAAFLGALVAGLSNCASPKDWRTASRESSGIAPDPVKVLEPLVQVYGARAWGWRGWFAIHTWVAVKPGGATEYTVYEVVGWRARQGLPVLRIGQDVPDRYWYGERPQLLVEHRGDEVEALIDAVDAAARSYPWQTTYRAFPGPNSNTFTAWVAQQVPQLQLELPFTAIGSGYLH